MSKSEVQVWKARLDLDPACISGLSQLLSEDERRKASRFYFARDRRRFTAARALLRLILGQCLDVAPARVEFAHSALGKPFLRDTTLRFNASRSADIALMAIADGLEVGVDVERVHPQPEMQRIAGRFFSSRDFAELQKAPAEAQAEVFFRLWTQTEARLKASGLGLGGARRQRHEHWPVCEVNPEVGYAGAVAAETCGINLTLHEFNFTV